MGQQISLLQAVVLAMAVAPTSAACAIPPDSNGHVDIPSRTNLATSAFHGCIDLRSISFPETGSFFPENGYRQSSLTQITIPDTVTNLPSNVFWDADSLTEAVIGNAVTWVGHHAFRSSALKQIVIPDSVTIVNEVGFSSARTPPGMFRAYPRCPQEAPLGACGSMHFTRPPASRGPQLETRSIQLVR